jgi:hypothetical protein
MKEGGTIPPLWCLIKMKRLPAEAIRLNGSLAGDPVSGFKVCSARHMAFGAIAPRKRLAHAGGRGGNRV